MRLAALTLLVTLALAAPARAGTYEQRGFDGWTPYAQGSFVAALVGAGGDLEARFWARSAFAPGEVAEWTYTAPADTTVASWDLERSVSGIGGGDWNTLFLARADGHARVVAADVPSVNRPWGWVSGSGLGADRPRRAAAVRRAACLRARRARRRWRCATRAWCCTTRSRPRSLPSAAISRPRALSAARRRSRSRRPTAAAVSTGRGRWWTGGRGRRWRSATSAAAAGEPYRFAFRQPCPLSAGATVGGRHDCAGRRPAHDRRRGRGRCGQCRDRLRPRDASRRQRARPARPRRRRPRRRLPARHRLRPPRRTRSRPARGPSARGCGGAP